MTILWLDVSEINRIRFLDSVTPHEKVFDKMSD